MKKPITFSNGNKKLKSTKEVRFVIFNLPAMKTCLFSTAHCRKKCYAVKAEKMYPGCLPCRERNLKSSLAPDFTEKVIESLSRRFRHPAYKNAKKIYFRIHESGDFYSQEYFDKWVDIATAFPRVTFLAYTKSLKFVLNSKKTRPANFIIRYSLWDDSPIKDAETGKACFPTYTAWEMTDSQIKALGDRFCECKDCGTCGKCYDTKVKDIVCEIH